MKRSRTHFSEKSPHGWWIATYIQRFEFKGSPAKSSSARCTAWENAVLIKAATREVAYRKAVAEGKRNSTPGWSRVGNPPGRLGRWVYEGLTSLLPVYEKLADGAELFWIDRGRTTLGAVRRRVKAKAQLEVFSNHEK